MLFDRNGVGAKHWASRAVAFGVFVGLTCVLLVLRASAQEATSRQVTVFGIIATPDSDTIDPKLKAIAPQLRRLFPNHGFKLVGVQSKRIATGQTHTCELGGGFEAQTQLVNPLDDDGKVMLRFELDYQGQIEFASFVTTPPNQLSFADKMLPDGSRLVIGLGVRP